MCAVIIEQSHTESLADTLILLEKFFLHRFKGTFASTPPLMGATCQRRSCAAARCCTKLLCLATPAPLQQSSSPGKGFHKISDIARNADFCITGPGSFVTRFLVTAHAAFLSAWYAIQPHARSACAASPSPHPAREAESFSLLPRLGDYLAAAADLARRQWTQFGAASMAAGLAVFAAAVALQLAACWSLFRSSFHHPAVDADALLHGKLTQPAAAAAAAVGAAVGSGSGAGAGAPGAGGSNARISVLPDGENAGPSRSPPHVRLWEWSVEGAAAAAALGHSAALFSNSFVLAEGHVLAFLLAGLTALLGRSTLALQLRCREARDAAAAAPDAGEAPEAVSSAGCVASAVDTAAGGSLWLSDTRTEARQVPEQRGGRPRQPTGSGKGSGDGAGEAIMLALLLLGCNWGLAVRGLVRRSGHDAMWRTAAEHHTLLVPDAAAAPAAAAATRQPVSAAAAVASSAGAADWEAGAWRAAVYTRRLAFSDTAWAAGVREATAHLRRLCPMDLEALAAAVAPKPDVWAAAWRQAVTFGPLLLLPALLLALGRQLQAHTLSGGDSADGGGARERRSPKQAAAAVRQTPRRRQPLGNRLLRAMQWTLLWSAYAFVALHWLWEDAQAVQLGTGGSSSDGSPSGATTLADAWALAARWTAHATSGPAASSVSSAAPTLVGALRLALTWLAVLVPALGPLRAAGSLLRRCLRGAARGWRGARVLLGTAAAGAGCARAHLALPRAAYACAAAAAALAVLRAVCGSLGGSDGSGGCTVAGSSQELNLQAADAEAARRTLLERQRRAAAAAQGAAIELAAAVCAPLALVLGRRGPAPLLLAALQAAALLRLLHLRWRISTPS